jgi:hypothetical protein
VPTSSVSVAEVDCGCGLIVGVDCLKASGGVVCILGDMQIAENRIDSTLRHTQTFTTLAVRYLWTWQPQDASLAPRQRAPLRLLAFLVDTRCVPSDVDFLGAREELVIIV